MVWLCLPTVSLPCHQPSPLKSAKDPVEFFLLWGSWLPLHGLHHVWSLQNSWPLPDHREQQFGQELVELFGLLSGRHCMMDEGLSIACFYLEIK